MEKKFHLGDLDENKKMDYIEYQKMLFICNALDDGWSVKKRQKSFIFTKNHEGKKEVFSDSYLLSFMKENFDTKKLLS